MGEPPAALSARDFAGRWSDGGPCVITLGLRPSPRGRHALSQACGSPLAALAHWGLDAAGILEVRDESGAVIAQFVARAEAPDELLPLTAAAPVLRRAPVYRRHET